MENKNLKLETGFLFNRTSFWKGIGSIFSLYGNYYEFNASKTYLEADRKALKSDWQNVGKDIKIAQKKFELDFSDELCLK
ncbi:MAG: hypothetical protein ACOVLC_08180 [Flavobacterium sp.]